MNLNVNDGQPALILFANRQERNYIVCVLELTKGFVGGGFLLAVSDHNGTVILKHQST